MRHFRVLLILLVGIVSIAWTNNASAVWYAGNKRVSAYGVYARIFTPNPAPSIAWVTPPGQSGEYNWVSAVGNGWVQAGWSFFPFEQYTQAMSYTEALTGGMYWGINFCGSQAWGTYVTYRVENYSGNCWRASWPAIGDGDAWCGLAAPAEMQAFLEVHGSTSNVANTAFRKVHYKKADGTWVNFDQAHWIENPPYGILDKTFLFKWNSVGP